MSEHHWEEEQRGVLGRLFDSIFRRREAPEDKIDNEIRWLHTLQLASWQGQPDHEPAARKGSNRPLEPDVGPSCQIWKRLSSSAPRSKSGNVKSISRNR
jgi:hypothetical protein